jgi:hypothetical protein
MYEYVSLWFVFFCFWFGLGIIVLGLFFSWHGSGAGVHCTDRTGEQGLTGALKKSIP